MLIPGPPGRDHRADCLLAPDGGGRTGDFHDVIDLNDGRVVLVIGDVAGVGVAAAEKADDIKAEVHRVFRRTDEPSRAFELLEEQMARAGIDVFATMALAVVDPASRVVEVASAGHPPVLVANGVEGPLPGGCRPSPAGYPPATTDHDLQGVGRLGPVPRHRRAGGTASRLQVLEMRGSDHDKALREFRITGHGIEIGDPVTDVTLAMERETGRVRLGTATGATGAPSSHP